MRLRVLVDLDGSTRNILDRCIFVYKRDVDPSCTLTHDDITHWGMSEFFPKVEVRDFFFREHAQEVFAEALPYDENLTEVWGRLAARYEMYVVTDQRPENIKFTLQWVERYNLPYAKMVFTDDKAGVGGHVGLDDKVEILEAYRSSGILPVCMKRPWNERWNGYKVNSLGGFEAYISLLRMWGAFSRLKVLD